MRILQVVPYLPKASGVTTFVVNSSDEMAKHGIEQVVCVNDQMRFMPVLSNFGVPRISTVEAMKLIREGSVDFVHFHGVWPYFMHKLVKTAKKHNVPYIFSLHGMLSPVAMNIKRYKKIVAWYAWQRNDLQGAAALHVTARMEAKWLEKFNFGVRVEEIPLGATIPAVINDKNNSHESRVLLFVGRVHRIKALDNLIVAWSKVDRRNWKVRIVGSDDGHFMTELKEQTKALGLEESVCFVGPKFGKDLQLEYENADCLILPSHSENFGGVVVDALGFGIPAIASKNTPWALLQEERCGWWTDNNPEELAKTITAMMSLSDEERRAMGLRGRELVKRDYEWSTIARKVSCMYEKCLKR